MNLDRLRERAESFLERTAREWYDLVRDPTRRSGMGARHLENAELFSLPRISDVQRAVSESAGLEERCARFLLEFVARGRARCAAASELDRRLDFEVMGAVEREFGRLRPADIPAALAATADPVERGRLEAAWLDALGGEAPVLHGLLARQRETYEQLGYGTFLQTCELLDGTDLRALARDSEQALSRSEGVYLELLHWFAPRLADAVPGELSDGDRHRLAEGGALREVFHASSPLPDTARLLAQTGIDPWAGGDVRLERGRIADRAGKVACCVLELPGQVVVVGDAPGRSGHAAALAALGRALQAAHTDPALPLELRWLGDEGVPLAWGCLLQGLLGDRSFLRDRYGVPREAVRDHQRLSSLLLLLEVRRQIGLLRTSLAWADASTVDVLADAYPELMRSATTLRHDPRQAAWDVGLPADHAARLRGALLAPVLADHLRDRFDEDWYRNPAAGEELRRMWAEGRRYTASEIAVQLTSAELGFGPLLARVEEMAG